MEKECSTKRGMQNKGGTEKRQMEGEEEGERRSKRREIVQTRRVRGKKVAQKKPEENKNEIIHINEPNNQFHVPPMKYKEESREMQRKSNKGSPGAIERYSSAKRDGVWKASTGRAETTRRAGGRRSERQIWVRTDHIYYVECVVSRHRSGEQKTNEESNYRGLIARKSQST